MIVKHNSCKKQIRQDESEINHANKNVGVDAIASTPEAINVVNSLKSGGANANIFGKLFENNTSMEDNLCNMGFIERRINNTKHGYYLKKKIENIKIIYLTQFGLRIYFKLKYNIMLYRNPDEAYIIKTNDKCVIKILEKKEQRREGSVETKLWAGPSLKREYEIILGNNFIVEYAYCVNKFLSNKFNSNNRKYNILKQILKENDIIILHGDEPNYYKKLKHWINTF